MKNIITQRTFSSLKILGICLLAAVLVFTGIPSVNAFAVTSSEKFSEANEILQRVDVLQTDLNKAQGNYDTAMAEHDTATKAMNEAQDRIEAAVARIEKLQTRLAGRASNMYKSGPYSFFDVLLGASTFDEFLTSWDMIEKISSQDASLVQETKDARTEAEDARKEYADQKAVAAEKMQQAKTLKEQIEATQASLKAEAATVTSEAMELQAQEELQAEQARQAAAAAESIKNQVYNPRPGAGAPVGNGQFSHPCPNSQISSTFGYRDFDHSFHKGVDFAAAEGTPYYAADSGTVLYATNDGSYNGGAGNWIVISHGNKWVTKYMHSSEVYVHQGDQVTRGQKIGLVGNTGNSFGAHLHFQVEYDNTAVNPLDYL